MKVTGNVPGLAGSFLVFDEKLQVMDGADFTDLLLTNSIVGELEGADISLVNPNVAKSWDVTFSLMGNDGKVIGAAKGASIPANGRISKVLTQIIPKLPAMSKGYASRSRPIGLCPASPFSARGTCRSWLRFQPRRSTYPDKAAA